MADVLHMLANSRQSTGKGAARAARREGQIPGVIYGAGKDPVHVTITEKILMKELHGPFYSSLYDIEIEGANKERVLPRDVQFHPVTDRPEHVDFLRVSARTKVTVNVPILIVRSSWPAAPMPSPTRSRSISPARRLAIPFTSAR